MTSQSWGDVKQVFLDALDRPPGQRESFVRRQLRDADALEQCLRMVRCSEATAEFLARRPSLSALGEAAASVSAGIDGAGTSRTGVLGGEVCERTPAAPPALAPGAVLAGRYELGPRLGAGAFGAVHRALDRVAGGDVAVKLLPLAGPGDLAAMRREVAALRRAHLPGVVDLLDDGVETGHAFLVMRLVDGQPFPGRTAAPAGAPIPWAELAPRALALLEALGRLHWLGVLHRDVKPDNVLVDGGGFVTIVDLGVARDLDAFGTSVSRSIVGTPAYLAPERLDGAPASVASDIYSVGVMLRACLTGTSGCDAPSIGALVRMRRAALPPIRTVEASVPAHVAAAVDAMLETDPSRRPRSARVAAALLRGEGEDGARVRLPFVGSGAAVAAVVGAVVSKRPIDLCGPAGCGRTRTLSEAAHRLEFEGYRTLRTCAGSRPFESLVPIVGPIPSDARLTLDDVRAWLRRSLGHWLDARVAILADDWAALDPQSRDVLTAVRDAGPLVRVFDGAPGQPAPGGTVPADAIEPQPRTEEELRSLFHGPDRIFHLREDGAHELHRRTSGRPGDCTRELESWVDGGIARWEDGLCRIDRDGIERLRMSPPGLARTAVANAAQVPASARDALSVLELAACPLRPDDVAQVLGAPLWEVASACETLASLGALHAGADGRVEAAQDSGVADALGPMRRVDLHAAIAGCLPALSTSRLHHLLRAGRFVDAARALSAMAAAALSSGAVASASRLAAEGLSIVRNEPGAAGEAPSLLATAFDAAMASGTEHDFHLLSVELQRCAALDCDRDANATLCEAALHTVTGDARRALAELDATPLPMKDPILRRYHAIRAFAVRAPDTRAAERGAVRDAVRWGRTTALRDGPALAREWLGWFRYRAGSPRRAARLHAAAARRYANVRARASALVNAASAHLEAGEPGRAAELCGTAAHACRQVGSPVLEGRREWILRSARYRAGDADGEDVGLALAAEAIGSRSVTAAIQLTEAAFAWRSGRQLTSDRLCGMAERNATLARRHEVAALARALRLAGGGPDTSGIDASARRDDAARAFPLIQLQVAALIAPHVTPGTALPAFAVVSADATDRRREIISTAEAEARMGRASARS